MRTYLGRDVQLAEAAVLKLEARTKLQTAPISSPIKTTKCLKSLVADAVLRNRSPRAISLLTGYW